MAKNFNFEDIKDYFLKKERLVSSIRTQDFDRFKNDLSFPYCKKGLKRFLVEEGGLSETSRDSYVTYLNNLLKEDNCLLTNEEFLPIDDDNILLAEIVVLLPCIFSVDKKHELGKKTIELICNRLSPNANKKDIRNARSALRKYGLFLETRDDNLYDNIPNINSKIKGKLQSLTAKEPFTYNYDDLYDKLDWSMWTQDRLKPSIKGICYPIRLISSLLTKDEKKELMEPCINKIRIYYKEGDKLLHYTVSDLKKNKWVLRLQGGDVELVKGNGNDDTEIVYDCDGEKLKAYVGSDISIEHEYSIANILEDDSNSFPNLTELSKLIWEICDSNRLQVTNSNIKVIYQYVDKTKMDNNFIEGLKEDLNTILTNIKINLSLMNTAKNSSKGKHD